MARRGRISLRCFRSLTLGFGLYQDDINNFGNLFVDTVDTTRMGYFLDSLLMNKHYVMFVGNAGTGKTALMRSKLASLDQEAFTYSTINLNSFSDAPSLQGIMEQPLEKKSGVRFGPPGARRLVYFFDDMNMPYVDKYDTQSPIELARQFVDYQGWFDKVKILLKEVIKTQLMACMNPTAGTCKPTAGVKTLYGVHSPSQAVLGGIWVMPIPTASEFCNSQHHTLARSADVSSGGGGEQARSPSRHACSVTSPPFRS
jgi:dynein heavy chain